MLICGGGWIVTCAVCAATILIEMPEIGSMDRKQVASLTGLAPMTRQSGQWRGKSFIQGGRKVVRDALYMPALVAMTFNPDLKAKYQAMIKAGKPPKVALIPMAELSDPCPFSICD
jgi:transposase